MTAEAEKTSVNSAVVKGNILYTGLLPKIKLPFSHSYGLIRTLTGGSFAAEYHSTITSD
jgi:hypothetical protein